MLVFFIGVLGELSGVILDFFFMFFGLLYFFFLFTKIVGFFIEYRCNLLGVVVIVVFVYIV